MEENKYKLMWEDLKKELKKHDRYSRHLMPREVMPSYNVEYWMENIERDYFPVYKKEYTIEVTSKQENFKETDNEVNQFLGWITNQFEGIKAKLLGERAYKGSDLNDRP